MNNIFVGNLSFKATKEDVVKLFEPFGSVANAVIMERKKGKSRGYGFVDMPNEEEKKAAIAALEGKEFMCRVLSVSPVIPKIKGELKAKKFKPANESKPFRKDDRASTLESNSASGPKYYSKFDGPPKPWRKANPDSKPFRKDDKGSRPYYGKKDRDAKPLSTSKPPYKKFDGQSKPLAKNEGGSRPFKKPGGGFKMSRKVSGIPKAWSKKGQARA